MRTSVGTVIERSTRSSRIRTRCASVAPEADRAEALLAPRTASRWRRPRSSSRSPSKRASERAEPVHGVHEDEQPPRPALLHAADEVREAIGEGVHRVAVRAGEGGARPLGGAAVEPEPLDLRDELARAIQVQLRARRRPHHRRDEPCEQVALLGPRPRVEPHHGAVQTRDGLAPGSGATATAEAPEELGLRSPKPDGDHPRRLGAGHHAEERRQAVGQ